MLGAINIKYLRKATGGVSQVQPPKCHLSQGRSQCVDLGQSQEVSMAPAFSVIGLSGVPQITEVITQDRYSHIHVCAPAHWNVHKCFSVNVPGAPVNARPTQRVESICVRWDPELRT